jgi:DNA-binding IclR family transcriptional regulator
MSYITAADIKSNLAQGFNLIDYLSEADSEITDLAERLGVRDSD